MAPYSWACVISKSPEAPWSQINLIRRYWHPFLRWNQLQTACALTLMARATVKILAQKMGVNNVFSNHGILWLLEAWIMPDKLYVQMFCNLGLDLRFGWSVPLIRTFLLINVILTLSSKRDWASANLFLWFVIGFGSFLRFCLCCDPL